MNPFYYGPHSKIYRGPRRGGSGDYSPVGWALGPSGVAYALGGPGDDCGCGGGGFCRMGAEGPIPTPACPAQAGPTQSNTGYVPTSDFQVMTASCYTNFPEVPVEQEP